MANCRNRINRAEARLRAAAAAAAEAAREETSMEEEIPMCRYTNPLPVSSASQQEWDERAVLLEQLLEQSCRQNQILLDLVSAVNGLAGAMLARNVKAES